jgi:hypothetical protein
MTVLGVEVVPGPVEVGGHHRQKPGPVLPVVGVAHLDPGDLGHGIGAVGGLQRPGEQILLFHRLGAVLGVDARRPQKDQPLDPIEVALVQDVALDLEVVEDELGRVGAVGVDPPHPGGRQKDVVGFFLSKKPRHGRLVHQLQLPVGPGDDVC